MAKNIIAKIILHTTGNVHIVMSNYQSVYATLENVLALFSDGYSFVTEGFEKSESSAKELRTVSRNLDSFQGLVLAQVYDDCSSEIFYPTFLDGANDISLTKLLEKINLLHLKKKDKFKDQKELYLKVYLDFVQPGQNSYNVERNTSAVSLSNNESIKDIVSFLSNCESDIIPKEDEKGTTVGTKVLTGTMVALKEYCEFHDLAYSTVANQIKRGKYSSAVKHQGKWYIDKNEPYNPLPLHGRKTTKFTRVSIDTYEDVQKTLAEKGWFPNSIRKYIRNYKEALYYVENSYKAVFFSQINKAALIIDICPDYYCPELMATNRELILKGLSPVVPNEYHENGKPVKYALHHIGMVGSDGTGDGFNPGKKSSPFRIISSKIHNSKEYYSIFHGTPTAGEVHNSTFESEKRGFWLTYIMEYDNAGEFYKIPHFNIKQTDKNKKKGDK